MDKRYAGIVLIVAGVAIIGLILLSSGYTSSEESEDYLNSNDYLNYDDANNVVTDNNGNVIHNATHVGNSDIVGTISGPKEIERGQNLIFVYKVTNKGNKTVCDVSIDAQDLDEHLGTLKPGQTKKFTYTEYIPTRTELKEEYGSDYVECNFYSIGGGNIFYKYSNGSEYWTYFDAWIEVKLV